MERSTVANRCKSGPDRGLLSTLAGATRRRSRNPGGSSSRDTVSCLTAGRPLRRVMSDAVRAQAAVTRLVDAYREYRPLPGRSRPAQAQPAPPVARAARAVGVRADRGRPGPRLLQPGERRRVFDAARADRDSARDVLPDDRRRVHAHPRRERSASGCSSGWSRCGTGPAFDIKKKRRIIYKLNAAELFETFLHKNYVGSEAVLARRGRDADPAPGRDHRAGRVRGRARRSSWACRTAAGSTSWRTSSTSPTA